VTVHNEGHAPYVRNVSVINSISDAIPCAVQWRVFIGAGTTLDSRVGGKQTQCHPSSFETPHAHHSVLYALLLLLPQ
jgi:hypothetical protein